MSSIIDNRDENTLQKRLIDMCVSGDELCIATAFFSLDALLLLSDTLVEYNHIRILFGDDAEAKQRRRLLELLREKSDEDLVKQREVYATLAPLKKVEALFEGKKVEARCYTAKKFHAKAYLVKRGIYPRELGVIGSGNFTRPGLKQNIELNVTLTTEQTEQLSQWYEERWAEAVQDVVTGDVLEQIRRQLDLYEPYVLYLKALYAWGKQQEADVKGLPNTELKNALDPHQEQGFRRALNILKKQHGVMVCDGVGLGKSFIALALMEYYCQEGLKVVLIAPKNILKSSWEGYIEQYLDDYQLDFGSIKVAAMTDLGFEPASNQEELTPSLRAKHKRIRRWAEQADVVVVDESHNFRTSSAARYQNLMQVVQPSQRDGKEHRKKVILLTATPINTVYRDISNQIALMTHETGNIGGYSIEQIRRTATGLDRDQRTENVITQLAFNYETDSDILNRVLASTVIQRSRATCKALAESVGKAVRFPIRSAPRCIDVEIGKESAAYKDLIKLADERFRPGVEWLRLIEAEIEKARKTGKGVLSPKLKRGTPPGIKLAAFLTEQYRLQPKETDTISKVYSDEAHLAGLVWANTLKQLESSPVAFQGILQSIGLGLLARLQHVFRDSVKPIIEEHGGWVRTPLFETQEEDDGQTDNPDIEDDGDSLDASGGEADAWLLQAVKARQLGKKLKEFTAQTFDVERWKQDIVTDLRFLHEVHTATRKARRSPDPKLSCVLPELRKLVGEGRKVLLFTQSQRTAEYLERELAEQLGGAKVARIDSRVEKTRAAILHAFCPGYNPPATAPSVPKTLNVLISTDVLSEGVNLQEAGAIVSYDIHWNPVRLIQRIGRVDRRLNPEITPEDHSFEIVNVLPPPEIDNIINLVGAVENRTLRISRTLGLDVSFFKANDPAGTLREFNSAYEGEITSSDKALNEYARMSVEPPDAKTQEMLKAIPPGAFGVWNGAPQNGLFALFTMEPTPKATEADKRRYESIVGRAVLALEGVDKKATFDAGAILTLLAGTKQGEQSGTPSDEKELSKRLAKLKEAVRNQYVEISLPSTIQPKLVCWMELRAS